MAQEFLRKKGYKIVDTNWRLGNFEIDIIAQKEDCLCFVEVKTRSSAVLCRPEDAVDKKRQQRLLVGARAYIKSHKWQGEARMDVISIVMHAEQPEIIHLEGAFQGEGRYY